MFIYGQTCLENALGSATYAIGISAFWCALSSQSAMVARSPSPPVTVLLAASLAEHHV